MVFYLAFMTRCSESRIFTVPIKVLRNEGYFDFLYAFISISLTIAIVVHQKTPMVDNCFCMTSYLFLDSNNQDKASRDLVNERTQFQIKYQKRLNLYLKNQDQKRYIPQRARHQNSPKQQPS